MCSQGKASFEALCTESLKSKLIVELLWKSLLDSSVVQKLESPFFFSFFFYKKKKKTTTPIFIHDDIKRTRWLDRATHFGDALYVCALHMSVRPSNTDKKANWKGRTREKKKKKKISGGDVGIPAEKENDPENGGRNKEKRYLFHAGKKGRVVREGEIKEWIRRRKKTTSRVSLFLSWSLKPWRPRANGFRVISGVV